MMNDRIPVRVVLDNIRSGLNVGSVFRTADAFALAGVDLCGYTARPPHRDILKSALGATESVPWAGYEATADCIAGLQADGWRVAVIEQVDGSVPIGEWLPSAGERWAVVLGNEVRGVAPAIVAMADVAVEIPQFGQKKSLNVSVCGGIVLHHISSCVRPKAQGNEGLGL